MFNIIKASELRKLNNNLEEQLEKIEKELIKAQQEMGSSTLTIKVSPVFYQSIIDILEENEYTCISLSNDCIQIMW